MVRQWRRKGSYSLNTGPNSGFIRILVENFPFVSGVCNGKQPRADLQRELWEATAHSNVAVVLLPCCYSEICQNTWIKHFFVFPRQHLPLNLFFNVSFWKREMSVHGWLSQSISFYQFVGRTQRQPPTPGQKGLLRFRAGCLADPTAMPRGRMLVLGGNDPRNETRGWKCSWPSSTRLARVTPGASLA